MKGIMIITGIVCNEKVAALNSERSEPRIILVGWSNPMRRKWSYDSALKLIYDKANTPTGRAGQIADCHFQVTLYERPAEAAAT